MKKYLRRLWASLPLTAVLTAGFISSAMADDTKPKPEPIDQIKTVQQQQQTAGYIDFSLVVQYPWVWSVVAIILGTLIFVILFKSGVESGVRIGLAGNNSDRAKAGLASAKNGLVGAAILLVFSLLIGTVLTLLITFII